MPKIRHEPPGLREAGRLLVRTVEGVQEKTDSAIRRSDRNRRMTITTAALLAIGSASASLWLAPNVSASSETVEINRVNQETVQAVNQAISELRAAGVPEDQLPHPVVIDPRNPTDPNAIIQATTATILARIRTDPAFREAAGICTSPQ